MDFQHIHQNQQQQQQPKQQINAGLARYRSAPSSYFASFLDDNTSLKSNSIRAGNYLGDGLDNFLHSLMPSDNISGIEHGSSSNNTLRSMKGEQMVVQAHSQHLLKQSSCSLFDVQPQDQHSFNPVVANAASLVDDSSGFLSSMNSNPLDRGAENSNLIRYNSLPAGLSTNVTIGKEYGAMRGMGNSGVANNDNAEASFSSTSRYHGFSSGQQSSGLMPSLSEIHTKAMGERNPNNISFVDGQTHRNVGAYITEMSGASWDESSILSDRFLKGLGHIDSQSFYNAVGSDNQDNEVQKGPPTPLSRHLSLPKTSAEMSAVETLMQDSVLCKLRAKRGCATHPRSIAERVRRTRISDRMRRLQEIVPNMDKQTNTSDMLDLAVDYIKGLQLQVKALAEKRANCTCSKAS